MGNEKERKEKKGKKGLFSSLPFFLSFRKDVLGAETSDGGHDDAQLLLLLLLRPYALTRTHGPMALASEEEKAVVNDLSSCSSSFSSASLPFSCVKQPKGRGEEGES